MTKKKTEAETTTPIAPPDGVSVEYRKEPVVAIAVTLTHADGRMVSVVGEPGDTREEVLAKAIAEYDALPVPD